MWPSPCQGWRAGPWSLRIGSGVRRLAIRRGLRPGPRQPSPARSLGTADRARLSYHTAQGTCRSGKRPHEILPSVPYIRCVASKKRSLDVQLRAAVPVRVLQEVWLSRYRRKRRREHQDKVFKICASLSLKPTLIQPDLQAQHLAFRVRACATCCAFELCRSKLSR